MNIIDASIFTNANIGKQFCSFVRTSHEGVLPASRKYPLAAPSNVRDTCQYYNTIHCLLAVN